MAVVKVSLVAMVTVMAAKQINVTSRSRCHCFRWATHTHT